jgi:hypothetical protein
MFNVDAFLEAVPGRHLVWEFPTSKKNAGIATSWTVNRSACWPGVPDGEGGVAHDGVGCVVRWCWL